MSLSRIYAIFIRQMFLIKSNPTRLAPIFLWVALGIIQWGFISKYLGGLGRTTFSFINVVLGAIILWEFMSRMEQGIMTTFLEDIWSRNFVNYFASPITIGEYISGLIVTSIATGVVGLLMMILIAGLGFGYNIFKIGLYLLPFILILFVFGIAMGIFISAVIFRLGPSAEWLGWPIPLVLSVFAGVFYPISTLPVAMQALARIIPASYVFESMRKILNTGAFSNQLGFNLLVGLALSIIYLLLAYSLFFRVYRYNLKNGTIARFNTE